jgi:hypothetical protein
LCMFSVFRNSSSSNLSFGKLINKTF